ncbi:hypothetical protein B0H14DRAFT_2621866 [Mycena olivaceomarginata]|nr:hypothetical protein B0H14DRAFT_2621866 [Mycena olivaceomarginata]
MGNAGATMQGMPQAPVSVKDSVAEILSRIDGATREKKTGGRFWNFKEAEGTRETSSRRKFRGRLPLFSEQSVTESLESQRNIETSHYVPRSPKLRRLHTDSNRLCLAKFVTSLAVK